MYSGTSDYGNLSHLYGKKVRGHVSVLSVNHMKTSIPAPGMLLFLAALLALTGCVERKLLIRSDPPGARVELNRGGFLEGETPMEVPFTRYGTYHVRAVLDGHEEFEGTAAVEAPWWAVTPSDLFTDVLLPFTFRDTFELTASLRPVPEPASVEDLRSRHQDLLRRAEEVRRGVGQESGAGGAEDR